MGTAQKAIRFCGRFAIFVLATVIPAAPEPSVAVVSRSPNPAHIVVTVIPPKATLYAAETQFFLAKVVGFEPTVNWSVEEEDGGTITDEGLYTAPKLQGVYHVTATTTSDPQKRAVAEVSVLAYCDPTPVWGRR